MTLRLLPFIAVVLAGVTATSVGMAVFAAISDLTLAVLFCTAAVLLDAFKYLAWPAAAILAPSRKVLATGLVLCALLFAVVSAWATYDRIVGAVQGRENGSTQRLADLDRLQTLAEQRLSTLNTQLVNTQTQAADLRRRGIVSKANELESEITRRADNERKRAIQQLESIANERLALNTHRGASVPEQVLWVLGIGFALALEVVPVLIFLSLVPTAQPAQDPKPIAKAEPKPAPKPAPQARTDDPLALLVAEIAKGRLPGVKQFAKEQGIGNSRASVAYKVAADEGLIRKTPAGYVLP